MGGDQVGTPILLGRSGDEVRNRRLSRKSTRNRVRPPTRRFDPATVARAAARSVIGQQRQAAAASARLTAPPTAAASTRYDRYPMFWKNRSSIHLSFSLMAIMPSNISGCGPRRGEHPARRA